MKKIPVLLFIVVVGIVAVVILIGLLGTASSVLAQEQELTETVPHMQPPPPKDDDLQFIAFFTDDLSTVTDLSENIIGEGTHEGMVKCSRNNCSQKTELNFTIVTTDPVAFEYKFTTRLALDPEAERAVVGGIGTISSRGQKERFSFTAIFQNNRDGTVAVTYQASRPDASFVIPRSPGTFEITSRPSHQSAYQYYARHRYEQSLN